MEENGLNALSNAMVRAVEKAGASTLRVDARGRQGASGVVFAPDLILTANHVVEREEDIRVGFPDKSESRARLAGRDPASDLCLLGLESGQAVPGIIASAEAQVGQFVLALGRPDLDGIQASMGIIGAVGGPIRGGRGAALERFIRTDAIPYPGFSGGPLVDTEGCIVGMNSSGVIPGVSLAIPVSTAWNVARSLQQYGRIRRGYLGVRSQAVELPHSHETVLGRSQQSGLLMVGIERGQPADQAGMMVGDILVGMEGHPIQDHDALLEQLAGDVAGRAVEMEILRGGKLVRLPVHLGERR